MLNNETQMRVSVLEVLIIDDKNNNNMSRTNHIIYIYIKQDYEW